MMKPLGIAMLLSFAAGCSTPIGAERASTTQAYRQLKITRPASSLRSDSLAASVLRRYELEDRFRRAPRETLDILHEKALHDTRRDFLLGLAELNYIQGERLRHDVKPWNPDHAHDYFLASAIYAWLFLFADTPEGTPSPAEPRFRNACILYNCALLQSLSANSVDLAARLDPGPRNLPFGQIDLSVDTNALSRIPGGIQELLFADRFVVRGLHQRFRQHGLGVPLIAVSQTSTNIPVPVTMPVTALLELQGGPSDLAAGLAKARLVLHSAYDPPAMIAGGQAVPLEADVTAPLAYTLNDSFIWNLGREEFLFSTEKIKSNIYLAQPYQPGRIPVLFVHGTFSSPAYWGELANAIHGDPELLQKCQIWHFIYNSGHPLPFSAAELRDSLTNIIRTLDPTGCDPALRQIVIIGHSQGGLLAKLMTTDTGDKLWRVSHEHSLNQSDLTEDQRALARRFFFYKPLPEVRRIIFVATPHRGSYLAGSFFRGLANVSLAVPKLVARSGNLFSGKKDEGQELLSDSPTSVTSLAPGNPWLLALAEIPPAHGVNAHSIIAVTGSGDPKSGSDGIVKYSSAHVDYVESELVVRSGHRCQGNPQLMAEVRRILHEHLDQMNSISPQALR